MPSKAVVLLSGGLDSATVLALARQNFDCYCLTVDYGQRHSSELQAARSVAQALGATEHKIIPMDMRWVGGSALTADVPVPKDQPSEGIPITYVPARNTILLSLAMAYAEVLGADDLFAGMNAVDYSGYPDCRPEYVEAFERLANLATKRAIEGHSTKIHAPLIHLSKAEIIAKGMELGVDYALTTSCYDPIQGKPCRHCDSCRIRTAGFEELGLTDPLLAHV